MGESKKLKYCAFCGAPLLTQQNGRPKSCCTGCMASYRKGQKQKQYYKKVKFPGIDDKELEIKLKELEKAAQCKRDRADFEREFESLRAHLNDKGLEAESLLGHPIDTTYINHVLGLTTSKKQPANARHN